MKQLNTICIIHDDGSDDDDADDDNNKKLQRGHNGASKTVVFRTT